MTTPSENLLHWLRDAYAMEKQSIESIEPQEKRLEHYPEMRAWVRDHVQASQQHREQIKQCIDRHGSSTSTLKDVAMTVMGNIQELTGTLASDEVLKNVIADYAFKHYQIACYRSLSAAAEVADDQQTKQVCDGILATNERLAEQIAPLVPQMTREYMQRDQADAPAKR